MKQKSPAQILFERTIRTWVVPAANQRARDLDHPIVQRLALVIWDKKATPSVYFNDEVVSKVIKVDIRSTGPISKGQAVTAADVGGLAAVHLHSQLRGLPYLFIMQGLQEKYFVLSREMRKIVGNREFDILRKPLATEGMLLSSKDSTLEIYLDVIRNLYDGLSPVQKRHETLKGAALEVQRVKKEATRRFQRHMKLPVFIAHKDDEFLPLLLEARHTYIDGYFFSCIASAATTADLICNRLVERYNFSASDKALIFAMTFGQKIQHLFSKGLLTDSLRKSLVAMNRVRNRHLHPKGRVRILTVKRDSLVMVRLLHGVLEETFSMYRDYTIELGKFVPKPLV